MLSCQNRNSKREWSKPGKSDLKGRQQQHRVNEVLDEGKRAFSEHVQKCTDGTAKVIRKYRVPAELLVAFTDY